jgi:hypothetical protein
MTTADVTDRWRTAFLEFIQQPWMAKDLKRSALAEDLMSWTSSLPTAIVRSCESLGWDAAAKWNPSTRLPQPGKEYLSIDVMALPKVEDSKRPVLWPMPLAVFELENHPKDVRVAYSLWKVLCIRASLRVVIAYRRDWERSSQLIGKLTEDVVGGMTPEERTGLRGETVVVVGNRGEGETFPWGYFKFWRLDNNVGRFEKI